MDHPVRSISESTLGFISGFIPRKTKFLTKLPDIKPRRAGARRSRGKSIRCGVAEGADAADPGGGHDEDEGEGEIGAGVLVDEFVIR